MLVLAGLTLGLLSCGFGDPVFVVWAVNDGPSQRIVELAYAPDRDPRVVRVPSDSVGVILQAPGRLQDATIAIYDAECRLLHEASVTGSRVRVRLGVADIDVADGHGVPDVSLDDYPRSVGCI